MPSLIEIYQKQKLKKWRKISPKKTSDRYLDRCYVTSVPNIRAGIGHTLSEYITGRIWAQKTGVRYAHCELLEPWESMLNFRGDSPTLQELKSRGVKIFKMPRMHSHPDKLDFETIKSKWRRLAEKGPVCIILGDGQNAFDIAYPQFELRQLYRSHPEFANRLDLRVEGRINVSVHIRRRNQTDMLNPSVHDEKSMAYKARYLESDYFLSLCRIIEETLGSDHVQFNLFSQGETAAFAEFHKLKNLRLCLDTDQYETFHNLTLSDILIVSPSSFSFKAGMLCPGLKLAKYPWWHEIPDDEEWVRVGERPDLEKENLISRIRSFAEDKTSYQSPKL